MNFEFATATRIIFGAGKLHEIGPIAAELGHHALVVTEASLKRTQPLFDLLTASHRLFTTFTVSDEPSIEIVRNGIAALYQAQCDLVISFGGGSAIDTGKAIAALATNPGDPLDYLEVIGQNRPLTQPPLPFIAIPTTAGTGAEVTRNAVLSSPEHQIKVSLRSPAMLPRVALVDPVLTYSLPPVITARTGMDALTQVLEPFVSIAANPLTDALCREGLSRGARALPLAYQDGSNTTARESMALTSLLGGLALANAKLGAVHGFAGPLGGLYHAPHGVLCARLLPATTRVNIQALQYRDPGNVALRRYDEIARLVTGYASATAADLVEWLETLGQSLHIDPLSTYGVMANDLPMIADKSATTSSMKGNPIVLTKAELVEILEQSL